MRIFFRSVMVWAVCVMGMALLSPLAAQSPVNQQAADGSVNIYNLDRDAGVGGIEIHGHIGKAVVNEAVKLLSSIRPDVDELTVPELTRRRSICSDGIGRGNQKTMGFDKRG
jgi:hypothetical protein